MNCHEKTSISQALIFRLTRDDRESIKFGKKSKIGTGGMDSKLNAATWALDRGVSVVICNGSQDNAIKTIVGGRKVGTFFTETQTGGTPVEFLAENGEKKSRRRLQTI